MTRVRRIVGLSLVMVMTCVSTAATQDLETRKAPAPGRMLLTGLYVGVAGLQALDTQTTLAALRGGAVEANPLMRGVVKSPAALIGVKGGVTLGSIVAAEYLWKHGRRKTAVVMLAGMAALMSGVVANNRAVLRR